MHRTNTESEHDVVILQNVMVKMRDDVELATDLYLPAKDGNPIDEEFPVLLYRTPYNKTQSER